MNLKPCPMCGNTHITIQSNGIGDYYVVCGDGSGDEGDCGCGLRTDEANCECESCAAERWNRRPKSGSALIADERIRQINQYGYTKEHDLAHKQGTLAMAGSCYAIIADISFESKFHKSRGIQPAAFWPFDKKDWKPSDDNIKNLTKAGALIAAEIDRLLNVQGEK